MLHYATAVGENLSVDAVVGYSRLRSRLLDISSCIYNWFGQCLGNRPWPGESSGGVNLGNNGVEQIAIRHALFARMNASLAMGLNNSLSWSVAPTHEQLRAGNRRILSPGAQRSDPSRGDRRLSSLVTGVEHELNAFRDNLQMTLFVKHYWQRLSATESGPLDRVRQRRGGLQRWGWGSGVSYHLTIFLSIGLVNSQGGTTLWQ